MGYIPATTAERKSLAAATAEAPEQNDLLSRPSFSGGDEAHSQPTGDVPAARAVLPTCEHCSKPFQPRKGTGGEPKRFCSADCRLKFHAEAKKRDRELDLKPHRSHRAPPCSTPPTIDDPPASAQSAAQQSGNSDFDWNDPESVILKEQPATACYFNKEGFLVIRQRQSYPDYDVVIIIAESNLDTFLEKLTDACGIPGFGGPE